MPYCTVQDLIAKYGEDAIVRLSDRINKPPTTIDQTIVNEAIADADAEINMYLQTRYKLPLAETPRPILMASVILAYSNLNPKQPKEAPELVQADKQRALLDKLAKGIVTLGLNADDKEPELANTVQISEGRNDFAGRY